MANLQLGEFYGFYEYLKQQRSLMNCEEINLERISNISEIDSFKQDVQCPLCYNIMIQPQSCKVCQEYFCKVCFNLWVKFNGKANECPCCSKSLQVNGLQDYVKNMNNLLSKVKLFCKNKQFGCNTEISYEMRKRHEETECQYSFIPCQNSGCQVNIQRKDLSAHLQICSYKLIKCEKCQENIVQNQIQQHNINECQYRKVSCKWCRQSMEFRSLEQHESNCPIQYKICCTCNTKIHVQEFQNHNREKCLEIQLKQQQQKYKENQTQNKELQRKLEDKENYIYVLNQQLEDLNIQVEGRSLHFEFN